MNEENHVQWENTTEQAPWIITDREFEPDNNTLGITQEEINNLKDPGTKVLEIGPGGGSTAKFFIENNIDYTGLEPTLAATDDQRAADLAARHQQLGVSKDMIGEKIGDFGNNPDNQGKYDLVIAQGVNFQNLSEDPQDFLHQLTGALKVLKPGGKLMFEITIDSGNPLVNITSQWRPGESNSPEFSLEVKKLLGAVLGNFGGEIEVRNRQGNTAALCVTATSHTSKVLNRQIDINPNIYIPNNRPALATRRST